MTTSSITGLLQVSDHPSIDIFYSVEGPLDGTKPTVLLSSSLAANIGLWDDFVNDFRQEYSIVRYDARFHGQSPPSQDPKFDYSAGHSMEDLTLDVLELLDHLNIKRLRAFIGLSIGAAVGVIFGAKFPERVERVIVVGTRATSNSESNANHTARIKFGYENGPRALGRQSLARWFDEDWTRTHPEGFAHAEDVYCGQSIQGYEASIAALRVLDLFPYVNHIGRRSDGGRFVFVAGELDGTVPRESQELATISTSKVVIIPGSGHITPIQMPDVFHRVVREIMIGAYLSQ